MEKLKVYPKCACELCVKFREYSRAICGHGSPSSRRLLRGMLAELLNAYEDAEHWKSKYKGRIND